MIEHKARSSIEYALIILAIAGLIAMGVQLRTLVKDTSIDAFMSADHPAVVSRDNVEEIFGLRDPIVIAVIDESSGGIFDAESLNLLRWITNRLSETPNVDPDRIVSLASATKIAGDDDFLLIEPFYKTSVNSDQMAAEIRAAVEAMPVYRGALVAADGKGALISAELIDQSKSSETYQQILEMLSTAPAGGRIHVAGEAAVSGFLGEYVDRDSRKLVPLGFLAVLITIFFSFRTISSVGLSLGVVAASVLSAVGFMAALGVPFFVITNGLVSILVGISIADSVHIMSAYYDKRTENILGDSGNAAWSALGSIWKPVFFTTLTTIFGFAGIVFSSSMPPMYWFGVFAIVGLIFAFLYSLLFLPAGLSRFATKSSSVFIRRQYKPGWITRRLTSIGKGSAQNPQRVLSIAGALFLLGVAGATQVKVDREQIGQFRPQEDIVLADNAINRHFSGSNSLHVVVEAREGESILTYERLKKVQALQEYAVTLPHVQKATSIVDYLVQLNGALAVEAADALPKEQDLIAQQFFLLTSSSDPTEWESKIDVQRQRALVKVQVDSGKYSDSRQIVQSLQTYLTNEFNSDDLSAYLSGRINTDYYWLKPLAKEHATSIAISLSLVLLSAMVLFRSLRKGIYTAIPVILSITVVYAVMGYLGVWLDAATSMFATIAIGLGIDFGIHTIDRIEHYRNQSGAVLGVALEKFFSTSGQALFVNFLAIFLCFSIIGQSALPTMERFGGICAIAIAVSFFASITVLPALLSIEERRRTKKAI